MICSYCRSDEITESVKQAKSDEIDAGVDGFMVYDLRIVDAINELWHSKCPSDNQLAILPDVERITAASLVKIPEGGVTIEGLK